VTFVTTCRIEPFHVTLLTVTLVSIHIGDTPQFTFNTLYMSPVMRFTRKG
jgi:hypothetical protein